MVCCDCNFTNIFILGSIGYLIYRFFFKSPKISAKPKVYRDNYEKDKVYLYQFKRLKNCPNLSPFCIKLETLCRTYNIPYEVCETANLRSRNGTLPFIELNGEHIADSDLIELRLRKQFNIPSLSTEQEAQSIALSRMTNYHLFYILLRYKSAVDDFYMSIIGIYGLPSYLSPILVPILKSVFGNKLYKRSVSAIGDFEPKEMDELLKRDLKVIQDSIKGKFIFGDKLTPIDGTVFGQLASIYYPFRTHVCDVLEKDFPELLEYCERVRKEVYPNDFTI